MEEQNKDLGVLVNFSILQVGKLIPREMSQLTALSKSLYQEESPLSPFVLLRLPLFIYIVQHSIKKTSHPNILQNFPDKNCSLTSQLPQLFEYFF